MISGRRLNVIAIALAATGALATWIWAPSLVGEQRNIAAKELSRSKGRRRSALSPAASFRVLKLPEWRWAASTGHGIRVFTDARGIVPRPPWVSRRKGAETRDGGPVRIRSADNV